LRNKVSPGPNGPSPISPIMEKFVRDECEKLDRFQITPWAFLKAGPPMRVKDFYGHEICYQGIGFEGSPRHIFWSRYIEPFLEDIVFRAVDQALRLSRERGIHPQRPLLETQGLLNSYVRKTFDRMAEIDRRLRGGGLPGRVALRNTSREQQAMEGFISSRVNAELMSTQSTRSRWKAMNEWFREHPLVGWSVTLAVAIAGLLSKLFGVW
jgi:hypothetical protein